MAWSPAYRKLVQAMELRRFRAGIANQVEGDLLPRSDHPWSTREATMVLCEFAEALLEDGYTGDGWEMLEQATKAIRAALPIEEKGERDA